MGRSGRSSGRERSLGLELADCSPPRIRPPLEGWRVSRCCGQGSPGQAGGGACLVRVAQALEQVLPGLGAGELAVNRK